MDVELHGRGAGAVLRILVDKPGGISHRECELVSQQVGTILDVEDVMAARYTLEVASPGLDRKLYKPADYERFKGHKVKLQLKAPQAGRRRIEGLLLGLQEGVAKVQDASGEVLAVAMGEIEKANLVPDFGREFAARGNPKRRHSR